MRPTRGRRAADAAADYEPTFNVIERGKTVKCLSLCQDIKNAQCDRLRQGTSDISCGSRNCHYQPQCNFTFTSPSIRLDGVKVGCFDNTENIKEWDIKGFNFLYLKFKTIANSKAVIGMP